MKFINFDEEQKAIQEGMKEVEERIQNVENEQKNIADELANLQARVRVLAESKGTDLLVERIEEKPVAEINTIDEALNLRFPNDGHITLTDKQYKLQAPDYIVASLAGGVATLIDFLVVKIPKTSTIKINGKMVEKSGSPLTEFFRTIGVDKDGKAKQWVTTLETWFKVPYDKSIDPDIKGMCPRTHRLHSLAHDPSPLGFLWGIKDLVQGTFSYVDRNGVLGVQKIVDDAGFLEVLAAPVKWFGHLISDIFTSAGVPIPGWTYLQAFQFGSIGDKKRTIADLARYMYVQGYDIRHLVTMSVSQAAIEAIVRIYHFLVNEGPETKKFYELMSEREYGRIKNDIKLHRMLYLATSVAAVGNVGKVVAYGGNPLAINLVTWEELAKNAVVDFYVRHRDSKDYEKVIEARHVIDENFEYLLSQYVDS